jgi:hypothetical protein
MREGMAFVAGTPNASLSDLKTDFRGLGVEEGKTLRETLVGFTRVRNDNQAEITRLKGQLKTWEEENAQLRAQMADLEKSHQEHIAGLQSQIGQYADASADMLREVDTVKNNMLQRVDRVEQMFEERRSGLQSEIDRLSEERYILIGRIDELQAKVRQSQIASPDPSLLVDGRIIEASAGDEVHIDRGRDDRIVLGMRFEVYDDAAALQQVDQFAGQLPRGKASIEVIKVNKSTSTCKVVRGVPGRPVVRDDVIANAIYDRSYRFKFLVHGKFDLDADGRPTEAEAEYIRTMVKDWGGVVVSGETLPGDLDFLILGVEPPAPAPLPENASPNQVDIYIKARQSQDVYARLLKQARDAQIPVLSHNRFFILTGYTPR